MVSPSAELTPLEEGEHVSHIEDLDPHDDGEVIAVVEGDRPYIVRWEDGMVEAYPRWQLVSSRDSDIEA